MIDGQLATPPPRSRRERRVSFCTSVLFDAELALTNTARVRRQAWGV